MPAIDETGARARTPDAPVQVIFVRLPAGAPRQPGEPALGPKRKPAARKSPPKGRTRKQEKKKMIKTGFAILVSLACYLVLGIYIPALGHVAVAFPLLLGIPTVGMWLGMLTFKGIVALGTFGALSKKLV